MIRILQKNLLAQGASQNAAEGFSYLILALLIVLLSVIIIIVTNKIILRIVVYFVKKDKYQWNDFMLERRVFHRIVYIIQSVLIYYFATEFIGCEQIIQRFAIVYMIIAVLFVLDALLNSFQDFYSSLEIYKVKPVKGFIQIVKIILISIGIIGMVSVLIGQSPWILFTGIGAFSAVLLLIFKDSILGLVAGIQLSANDMIRIGDWIEMPKYNADGDVVDISLNTVKVENFDHTITTIPTYTFISDSFKNWRNIQNVGGRRIKRAINIDINSVVFCTDEMIERFSKIYYLTEYIRFKKNEIETYNKANHIDDAETANGRHMTNIGVFRAFIQNYLSSNPNIRQDMVHMVRQLPPQEKGIPLEIYAFSTEIEWEIYETVQADLFDYILAVAPQFGIRIFQNPTGHDMK